MDALRTERRARARATANALGFPFGIPRVTETAVRTLGQESNIAALPPQLGTLPGQTPEGEPYFVLGLSALDSNDVVA